MKQRGFGLLELGMVLAGLALLVALVAGAKAFVDGLVEEGFDRGVATTKAQYAERDNKALREMQVKYKEATERVRALESKIADGVAAADAELQKGLKNANAQLEKARSDLRTANLRLRDPGGSASPPFRLGGVPSAPAGGAGQRDARAGSELSAAAAEFLLNLAGEADEVVLQLRACQAVVRADRQ